MMYHTLNKAEKRGLRKGDRVSVDGNSPATIVRVETYGTQHTLRIYLDDNTSHDVVHNIRSYPPLGITEDELNIWIVNERALQSAKNAALDAEWEEKIAKAEAQLQNMPGFSSDKLISRTHIDNVQWGFILCREADDSLVNIVIASSDTHAKELVQHHNQFKFRGDRTYARVVSRVCSVISDRSFYSAWE